MGAIWRAVGKLYLAEFDILAAKLIDFNLPKFKHSSGSVLVDLVAANWFRLI